jgi:acetylornithine/LysW-gamma-L-lysine aminotransferase
MHGDQLVMNTIESEELHGPQTYQKFPVVIVRGSGAEVWDDQNNLYIDCMGGYGVAIVGHCNPEVVAAIKSQAERLITCHGSLYNDARATFLEKLTSCTPKGLDAAFLSNSGAEANEVAIKLAKKFTGKKGLIAMKGAFHGKTAGALSATWSKKYKEPFEPLLQGFKHVEFGNLVELEAAIDADTAGVMLEPIQGEGGIIMPPPDYLKGVREICDRRGVLMIADEVQTGLGRTGKMWAVENWGVVPDVLTSAKGLAGGVPIGATVARREILHSLKKGEQTSTFGGNPLSCAAGTATLDYIIKNDLPGQAVSKGSFFLDELRALVGRHRIGREARGLGLMLALEMRVDIQNLLLNSLKERVLFTYSGRTVVRLLPPLVMTEHQIRRVVEVLDRVIASEEAKSPG